MTAELAPGTVRIDVPAIPRSLRLLRLAAAGVASDTGFDLDGVESARVAVDELASVVMTSGLYDRLVVTFRCRSDGLHVDGSVSGGPGRSEPLQTDRIVEELLAVCSAEWAVEDDDAGASFWFRLEPSPA